MKVTKNSPAFPFVYKDREGDDIAYCGVPLRLELASRFLAQILAMPGRRDDSVEDHCVNCLKIADKLIEKHNETCEG